MKSSWIITFFKAGPAPAGSSVVADDTIPTSEVASMGAIGGALAEQLPRGRGERTPRALGATASLVRVLMRGGCVLVTVLAVAERGLGVLLGLVMLAHLVVVCRLQVVVSGGSVMGCGLMMVLGCGVRGRCCHRSILPGGSLGLSFVPGQKVSQL